MAPKYRGELKQKQIHTTDVNQHDTKSVIKHKKDVSYQHHFKTSRVVRLWVSLAMTN